MLNSEPTSELDKQRAKMAATEAGSPRRLGINLNLSVQPHVPAYHWPHSTVAEDASPSRSKGCPTDEDDDDDDDDDVVDDRDLLQDDGDDDDDDVDGTGRRQDGDCSAEDEQDILEMQREERETLNQLARQLASGSRLMAPMLQHLVYQHPGLSVQPSPLHHHHHHHHHQQQQQLQMQSMQLLQPSGVAVSQLTSGHRQPAADRQSSPKSSHSGDAPMSGGRPADVHSPSVSRNSEAQSWTFEEQFRQLYSAGNENDRRSFLDSLFSFMQEQGTPISRLPIMAKRVLDLYTLYKLVVQRGGIVAVITKKLWQEIIRGLGLPPSITSAAFTLRTQYVKYLYAYESRMNQFSTLDELNVAIAGNRREGRRNKSLMYSDMPPPPPGHHRHQQHQIGAGGGAPPQPPQSHHHHHHQHFANALAADDRFRHLAAAIIDNHHHGLRQSCSPPQQQQQQERKTPAGSASRSPVADLPQPPPPPPPLPPTTSLQFNGHHAGQQTAYFHQQQSQHQSSALLQSANEQTNSNIKQRELLSMLMWMDIVRANQTLPRLPMPSLPPSSPSAAYTMAAALNLTPAYKGPMAAAAAVPEQSEALNLGKKRTSTNNNDDDDEDDEDDKEDEDELLRRSAAKRIKTEPQTVGICCSSDGETAETPNGGGSPSTTTAAAAADASSFRYLSSSRRSCPSSSSSSSSSSSPPPPPSPIIDEDVVEMDINASASTDSSGNSGLAICVTRRTKNGVYRGELTKSNSLVNGGLNNNANPFVLHLNGDLYTGHLQLQQQRQTTSN